MNPPARTPPAAPAPPEDGPPPPDLRLVPAALLSWGVALAALALGWGVGAVLTTLAIGAAVVAAAHRGRTGEAEPSGSRPGGVGAAVLAAGACAGAVGLVATLGAHAVADHPLRPGVGTGAWATVDVVVTTDPRPLRSAVPGAAQVLVGAEVRGGQVGAGGRWRAGGAVVIIAPAEHWARVLPGQGLTARGRLAAPQRADLTVAALQVRGPPRDVGEVPLAQRIAGDLRGGLRDASRAVLAEDPGALLPGLVVGDTAGISAGLADDFRTAGLTHLTAVSGTNVAIVCGAVLLAARAARAGPRTAAVLAALALMGFVVLARPSPSVLRAAVMGGVTVLALAVGRRRSVVPALAATVVVLLLVDPGLAVDPGFALSVLATGALVLLAPGMVTRMRARRVPPGVAEALAVPVAAHVVTAPVVAGLSGEVSLVAVVANLFAAPLVAPVTVLGVLAAAVAPWWTGGAHALVRAAGPGVSGLVWVARRCAAVPGASITWPGGVAGGLALAGLVVGVGLALRWRRLRALCAAALVGALLVLVPTRVVPPGWPPTGWALVACDVGQGDGLVLATGEPGRAVLVDVGAEAGAIDACLTRLGVRALALVVLTHLHADHVGGLAGALDGRSVGAVALGPVHEPADALGQVLRRAGAARAPVVALTRGTVLRWPALAVEVLGPVRPVSFLDTEDGSQVNDTSVVLRAWTPVGRVLLPGDAERSAQSALLGATDLRAEILKVPHHGSRSSLPSFLTASRAGLALVSVGRGNTYGHPNPQVMRLLQGSGALVRRTDEGGDLAVVATPDRPAVVARGDPRPDPRRR